MEDRPFMLDYWGDSLAKTAFIGVKSSGEKILVKNEGEYTSPIAKIFKVDDVFIVTTENSLYIVSSGIQSRRIKSD